MAQAGFGHRLGRRALGWGAVVGMLPDLDIAVAPLHGGFGEMVYHRGSTHALWFGPVVGPLVGWGLWRWRDGAPERRGAWLGMVSLALFTHPLLDVFTPYGTQLLAPFSRARFAWNGVGIIDPIVTLVLALGVALTLVSRARRPAVLSLLCSSAYLVYGVAENRVAENDLRQILAAERGAVPYVRAYPTLFQPWLRRFVAHGGDEIHVGLYTSWRRREAWWQSFAAPGRDARVDDVLDTWRGRVFAQFAMDQLAWRVHTDGNGAVVEVEDLRYGFPGPPPDRGLWGIRARYAEGVRRVGPVERFTRRDLSQAAPLARAMWRATWGDWSLLPRPRDEVPPDVARLSPRPETRGQIEYK